MTDSALTDRMSPEEYRIAFNAITATSFQGKTPATHPISDFHQAKEKDQMLTSPDRSVVTMDARDQARYISADILLSLEEVAQLLFAARVVQDRLNGGDAGSWLAANAHHYEKRVFRTDVGGRRLGLARRELSSAANRLQLSFSKFRLGPCEDFSPESLEVIRKAFETKYIVVDVDDYSGAAYHATDHPYILPLMSYSSINVCTFSREASHFAYEQSKHLGKSAPISPQDGEADILYEIRESGAKVYHLGVDELPHNVQDIRGAIRDESGQIYASVSADDRVSYFALVHVFVVCPECGAIVLDDCGGDRPYREGATSPCHKQARLEARPAWG